MTQPWEERLSRVDISDLGWNGGRKTVHFSKLKTSADAASKLRSLRQRTGLTPNLICRIGIVISLEEGPVGEMGAPDEEGLEFNAYTLVGEYGALFSALIRWVEEEALTAPLTNSDILSRMRAHLHRGIGTLSVRAKTPADILGLVPVMEGTVGLEAQAGR
jgi:DNA sulfur modification protein DndE